MDQGQEHKSITLREVMGQISTFRSLSELPPGLKPKERSLEDVTIEDMRFWAPLFRRFFMECEDEARDDMLYFVPRASSLAIDEADPLDDSFVGSAANPDSSSPSNGSGSGSGSNLGASPGSSPGSGPGSDPFFVRRRTASNLPDPSSDTGVDWERSMYLNLVLHHVEYALSVSTHRLGDYAMLRKVVHKVDASASAHRMDQKSVKTVLTYPKIFFTIDNFDDMFEQFVVEPGQAFVIKLHATMDNNRATIVMPANSVVEAQVPDPSQAQTQAQTQAQAQAPPECTVKTEDPDPDVAAASAVGSDSGPGHEGLKPAPGSGSASASGPGSSDDVSSPKPAPAAAEADAARPGEEEAKVVGKALHRRHRSVIAHPVTIFGGMVEYPSLHKAFFSARKRNSSLIPSLLRGQAKGKREFLMLRGPAGRGKSQVAIALYDDSKGLPAVTPPVPAPVAASAAQVNNAAAPIKPLRGESDSEPEAEPDKAEAQAPAAAAAVKAVGSAIASWFKSSSSQQHAEAARDSRSASVSGSGSGSSSNAKPAFLAWMDRSKKPDPRLNALLTYVWLDWRDIVEQVFVSFTSTKA